MTSLPKIAIVDTETTGLDRVATNGQTTRTYASHVNFFMRAAVLVGIGLAGYGYYILTYVA